MLMSQALMGGGSGFSAMVGLVVVEIGDVDEEKIRDVGEDVKVGSVG
jgi:hypothetical protein